MEEAPCIPQSLTQYKINESSAILIRLLFGSRAEDQSALIPPIDLTAFEDDSLAGGSQECTQHAKNSYCR